MSKTLVLAEKPSVGKDIGKALGAKPAGGGCLENEKYVVTWALGHLVTLADPDVYNKKYEKWDLNDLPILPKELKLVVIKGTAKQYNLVKAQLLRKDVGQVVIATDAGREGELVARWILEKSGVRKPLKRLWISSVTEKAIKEGFQKLRDGKEYENLYHSAAARAEADWLVGINATRALTTKFNAQLSCGRVQTPTLAMISKREQEIQKFVPKAYFGITAQAKGVNFTWYSKGQSSTFDESLCDEVIKNAANQPGKLADIKKSLKKTMPPLLYDLTQLQADANRLYNYSAKETLNTMQSLYESHKALTYPRTDSKYLSTDIVPTIPERLKACSLGPYKKICFALGNKKFPSNLHFVNNQKVSDHHAIIPTEQSPILENMNEKERRIYDMVIKRFLAALYPAFEYEQTDLTMEIGREIFKAKGKRVLAQGFREVYHDPEDEDDAQTLPDFKKGESLKIQKLTKTSGKTKPPAPFTEASLLTAMENPAAYMETSNKELIKTIGETGGIGTVATRADIIEKLFNSFVMEKRGKDIFITQKGRQLLQLAPSELTSPLLTARWEQRLMGISQGKENQRKFIEEITQYTKSIISQIKSSNATFRHDNITREHCPDCGKFLLEVAGKKGKMLVCQDRECGYRQSVSVITNARCPLCHKKLELIGQGDKRRFVCVCGHKESYESFQERREKEGRGVNKRDVERYLDDQKKERDGNFALADALSKIKFD